MPSSFIGVVSALSEVKRELAVPFDPSVTAENSALLPRLRADTCSTSLRDGVECSAGMPTPGPNESPYGTYVAEVMGRLSVGGGGGGIVGAG